VLSRVTGERNDYRTEENNSMFPIISSDKVFAGCVADQESAQPRNPVDALVKM